MFHRSLSDHCEEGEALKQPEIVCIGSQALAYFMTQLCIYCIQKKTSRYVFFPCRSAALSISGWVLTDSSLLKHLAAGLLLPN